jgi:hypothetical protein
MNEHVLRDLYIDTDRHRVTAECSCQWLSNPQDTEDRAFEAWQSHKVTSLALECNE